MYLHSSAPAAEPALQRIRSRCYSFSGSTRRVQCDRFTQTAEYALGVVCARHTLWLAFNAVDHHQQLLLVASQELLQHLDSFNVKRKCWKRKESSFTHVTLSQIMVGYA